MSLESDFIANLRRIRKEKNVSQEKLAELCQSDTSYIGQIEIGRRCPSLKFVEKIADALGIEAYTLFLPEKDKSPNEIVYHISDETLKGMKQLFIAEMKRNSGGYKQ
ncbi:helix-turn-helix domain-containing protein [Treponema sp.]|uniref:helix-turn-helix domain-containing protein n=1 Tax=Treponema sp. TaxID=166 RepID=UPI0025EDF8DA|nr:helix-turn-helix transcriptional regulator [Treponema sp.]MBR4322799.1 helix-turn-helix transcriptional regulator [Treponema sp.]